MDSFAFQYKIFLLFDERDKIGRRKSKCLTFECIFLIWQKSTICTSKDKMDGKVVILCFRKIDVDERDWMEKIGKLKKFKSYRISQFISFQFDRMEVFIGFIRIHKILHLVKAQFQDICLLLLGVVMVS